MKTLTYLSVVCTVIAIFCLVAGPLGTRFGFWHYQTGLTLMFGSFLAAFLAIVFAVILLIVNLIAKQTGLWVVIGAGISVGAVIAVSVFVLFDKVRNVPLIHNISTDTVNPPQYDKLIAIRGEESNSLEYTDDIANIQLEAYPEVKPLLLSNISVVDCMDLALASANELGWEVVSEDRARGHIEAIDTTFWFGFKDDVVVRIREEPEIEGSRIDVRSVSRVGLVDLGKNASRILEFTSQVEELAEKEG